MEKNDKRPKVGVGVFVFRNGKFLISRRIGSHGEGSWQLPGGHQEWAESPEETALREVTEEVGVIVTNPRFGGLTNDFFIEEDKHYITIWMLADLSDDQEPYIAEKDKLEHLKWVNFEELQRFEPLFLPWHNLFASEFIENIKIECKKTKSS